MICRNARICKAFDETACISPKYTSTCEANLDFDMKERMVKAFTWLAENIDETTIEFTGTHYQMYEGFGENLVREGRACRTLLATIESCYT